MNYTKNYHLPQWVKSDRIMMEDFNAMCTDIEAGLTQTRDQSAAASQKASADCSKLEELVQKGLRRSAYIHYCHLAMEDAAPQQIGMFRQAMDGKTLPSNVTGMTQQDQFCWLTGGGTFTDADILAATTSTDLKIVKDSLSGSSALRATFTAPGAGQLRSVQLHGTYNWSTSRGKVKVLFTDTASGEKLAESETELGLQTSGGGGGDYTISVQATFHAGQTCRLEIQPLEANCTGTFQLVKMPVTPAEASGPATVQHSFQEADTSQGGIVLVRYRSYGKTPNLSLLWDGETYQPVRTWTITDTKGCTLKEAEFYRSATIPVSSSLQLKLSCPEAADLALYEWGAMLI